MVLSEPSVLRPGELGVLVADVLLSADVTSQDCWLNDFRKSGTFLYEASAACGDLDSSCGYLVKR